MTARSHSRSRRRAKKRERMNRLKAQRKEARRRGTAGDDR